MKKTLLVILSAAIALTSYGQMKKLVLEVPQSQLSGTPVPVKLPNLEPKGTNPEVMIPADATNIAKGKKVTSSDDFPLIGELELVTDGDKDAAEGCYVELMNGLQWIQIDLEKSADIYAIALWHYHSQERAYKDVIIQISDDPEFKNGVTTVFNNDDDNSAKMGVGKNMTWVETNYGKIIEVKPSVKGRYVRFYSNGNTTNDTNAYIEVEIYGK